MEAEEIERKEKRRKEKERKEEERKEKERLRKINKIMEKGPKNLFETILSDETASNEELLKKQRLARVKFHSDKAVKFKNEKVTKKVKDTYDFYDSIFSILLDDQKRQIYIGLIKDLPIHGCPYNTDFSDINYRIQLKTIEND